MTPSSSEKPFVNEGPEDLGAVASPRIYLASSWRNKFLRLLQDPLAVAAHRDDTAALTGADVVVLCTPAGASSHLEAGVAIGHGIPLLILIEPGLRPELTYRDATLITPHLHEIVDWFLARALSTPPPTGGR